MRIHAILADAALEIIKLVFKEHQVLDHELSRTFEENPKWGKRDRSFIAETVFEVVRWKRALAFLADSEETKALMAAQWVRMGYAIPEWWTHQGRSAEEMVLREELLLEQPRCVRASVPDWMDEAGVKECGEERWEKELNALNQRTQVYLRINRLKTDFEKCQAWLSSENVIAEPVPGLPDALVLPPKKTLPKNMRYDGRLEIQDAGSQMISLLAKVQPGMFVIDACSGAGGKTLHLASLMGTEGRIYGMDVDARKLIELERRAARAGARNIKTKVIVPTTPSDFENLADVLLIDAPCSGIGTLRRQPDLKWRLKPSQFARVKKIQEDLLKSYPTMLKVGGTLVYATCSIFTSENQAQIERLIATGNFELIESKDISPAEYGFDGFYAVALKKIK